MLRSRHALHIWKNLQRPKNTRSSRPPPSPDRTPAVPVAVPAGLGVARPRTSERDGYRYGKTSHMTAAQAAAWRRLSTVDHRPLSGPIGPQRPATTLTPRLNDSKLDTMGHQHRTAAYWPAARHFSPRVLPPRLTTTALSKRGGTSTVNGKSRPGEIRIQKESKWCRRDRRRRVGSDTDGCWQPVGAQNL